MSKRIKPFTGFKILDASKFTMPSPLEVSKSDELVFRELCAHEAGHAIVAAWYGCKVTEIQVTDCDGEGVVFYQHPRRYADRKRVNESHIIAAGYVANEVLECGAGFPSFYDRVLRAPHTENASNSLGGSNDEIALSLTCDLSAEKIGKAIEETRAILNDSRAAVETVTDRLVECGPMTKWGHLEFRQSLGRSYLKLFRRGLSL